MQKLYSFCTLHSSIPSSYCLEVRDIQGRTPSVSILYSRFQSLSSFRQWMNITRSHLEKPQSNMRTESVSPSVNMGFSMVKRKDLILKSLKSVVRCGDESQVWCTPTLRKRQNCTVLLHRDTQCKVRTIILCVRQKTYGINHPPKRCTYDFLCPKNYAHYLRHREGS